MFPDMIGWSMAIQMAKAATADRRHHQKTIINR
jgi:hypothetical protein